MTTLRRFASWAALCALVTTVWAEAPLARYFSARSYFALQVENSPELRQHWQDSPWSRTYRDEQVQQFLAPMLENVSFDEVQEKIKAETGRSVEELLGLFHGSFGAAIGDFKMGDDEGGEPSVSLVFLLELNDQKAVLEDLLKPDPKKPAPTTWDFRGVTVHEIKGNAFADNDEESSPEDADSADQEGGEDAAMNGDPEPRSHPDVFWALVGNHWAVATPRAAIEETIVSLQENGARESLAASADYREVQEQAKEHPVTLYINFARFLDDISKPIEQKVAASARENPQSNPLGLTVRGVLHATGLDTLRTLYFGAGIGKDSTDFESRLTYSEERGITKFFAGSTEPAPKLPWVRSNWSNAGVMRFSIPQGYATIEEILGGMSPGLLTMVQGQLQVMQQRFGVDLKRDVVGALGDVIVVGDVPAPDRPEGAGARLEQQQNFVAIAVTDPQRLVSALEALGSMGGQMNPGMFESRDYLGAKLYSMRQPPNAPPSANSVSFTVANGFWMIALGGGTQPIETVLQTMNGSGRDSLWDLPVVKKTLDELPPGAIAYSYQNMAAMFATLAEAAVTMQTAANAKAEIPPEEGEEPEPPAKPMIDISAKPPASLWRKYWSSSVGASWRDNRSIHSLTRISHTPADQ